jgi:hypothetical protein
MARENVNLFAFNRGLCSKLGLARADIRRMAMAAETYKNWMPRKLGSMMLRPGLRHIASTYSNLPAKFLPFIFSVSDKAKIELTDLNMRVWLTDTPISRPVVSSAVTNGTFAGNITNWTGADEAGATSAYDAGSGDLGLTGNGTNNAIRYQQITVAAGDLNIEHALRIVIDRGPVVLRVGSTAGDDDYISETSLDEGTHSLALTPTGNFFIQFQSKLLRIVFVSSVAIESSGDMLVPTPWSAANLKYIKHDQSGDILFCACTGIQQYKIERRATRSWSVVKYLPEDGPMNVLNVTPITMTASVLTGNGTMTASKAFFKSTDVGSLMAMTSTGQTVSTTFTGTASSNSILVEGITTERAFTIQLVFAGAGTTVILERSFDNTTWVAVAGKSWTANTTESYTDGLDNESVYYRLTCSVYSTNVTTVKLSIATGSNRGVVRFTGFTTNVLMNMEVLETLGSTKAETDWEVGLWSARRGWPTSVTFYEGRLWWFGKNRIIGSAADAFYSFDPSIVGDDQVINRAIGSGPVDMINWAIPLQRLILGSDGAEISCRSSSLDEPLTPTNFNIKKPSTQGSSYVSAVVIDDTGIFVQSSGTRLFKLNFNGVYSIIDFSSSDLTTLIPEIGLPQIIRLAVQRKPDTRIHCLRSDGTVAVFVFDNAEDVQCWIEVDSTGATGLIEDILVLPGDLGQDEDQVFYLVNRTIGGVTKRYLEQWAFESTCKGGNASYLADSHIHSTGQVISGLSHLEGQQVVVWADGKDVGYDANDALIYTVSGGSITLAASYTDVVVGLPYTAQWQSGKLVQLLQGNALKTTKQIKNLGLIMADVHYHGVKFGKTFDSADLDDLPSNEYGGDVAVDTVHSKYDEYPFVFPGQWETDTRLCLQAKAPRPVTILAAICDTEFH